MVFQNLASKTFKNVHRKGKNSVNGQFLKASPGVGKLQPTGQMRPSKSKSAALNLKS